MCSSERLQLYDRLVQLTSMQFTRLVYELEVPAGEIPPTSVASGERAERLLNWVQSPAGCDLSKLNSSLQSLLDSPAENRRNIKRYLIKRRNFCKVWSIKQDSLGWHTIPHEISTFPIDMTQSSLITLQYIEDWKFIHSATETLYRDYIELSPLIRIAEFFPKNGELYLQQAESLFNDIEQGFQEFIYNLKTLPSFGIYLNELPRDQEINNITVFLLLPILSDAIRQSFILDLSSVHDRDYLQVIKFVVEKVEEWLYQALHLADEVLREFISYLRDNRVL
jgi:hypothetical protein